MYRLIGYESVERKTLRIVFFVVENVDMPSYRPDDCVGQISHCHHHHFIGIDHLGLSLCLNASTRRDEGLDGQSGIGSVAQLESPDDGIGG